MGTNNALNLADLRDGKSLSLEGRISIVSGGGIHLPDARHAHLDLSLNAFKIPEEEMFAYTGKFNLYRRALEDRSPAGWLDHGLKESKVGRDCIGYAFRSEEGELILSVGTDGPLQATRDDRIEGRLLYWAYRESDDPGKLLRLRIDLSQ